LLTFCNVFLLQSSSPSLPTRLPLSLLVMSEDCRPESSSGQVGAKILSCRPFHQLTFASFCSMETLRERREPLLLILPLLCWTVGGSS
jgi:hypothetical protein